MAYIVTLGEREAALIGHRINYVMELIERELKAAGEESTRSELSLELHTWTEIHKALLDTGR